MPFKFVAYPGESDLNGGTSPNGLYPIPTNMPVEGWPTQTGGKTLAQWQTNYGGDRHSIIVQPGNGLIYESWQAQLTNGNWKAANGAIFNLNTTACERMATLQEMPAGFPMFPALVRFDECERGMVEHACRLVVVNSRAEHIYPARHDAGSVGRRPNELSRNGPAAAAQGELHHHEFMDEAGKGSAARFEKIRRNGVGQ